MRRTRLGPRPLPLLLGAAFLTWTRSRAACGTWKSGSPPWNWGPELESLLRNPAVRTTESGFAAAVDAEILRRSHALLAGVAAYRNHPFERPPSRLEEIRVQGTTRLLGPARTAGAPILIVPSLINRWYVLDLVPGRSLVEYLGETGFTPYVVDWGAPGPVERRFGLTDYVAGRLEHALETVLERTGRKPVVIGYCMGGVLAMALARRRLPDLAALVLMATPWDFSAGPAGRLITLWKPALAACLDLHGELPTDVIQTMFHALDPMLAVRKFLRFAAIDGTSSNAESFVALEDWINDGVPLAAPAARETLFGWYCDNTTARGCWTVAGEPVIPEELEIPSLVLIPSHDRIVPPESAAHLAAALPQAVAVHTALGHIGMVASAGARQRAWVGLTDWLAERA